MLQLIDWGPVLVFLIRVRLGGVCGAPESEEELFLLVFG